MQSYLDPDQYAQDKNSNNSAPPPAAGYLSQGQNAPAQGAPAQQQIAQVPPQGQQPAINPTPTGTNIPGMPVNAGTPTIQQQQALQQQNSTAPAGAPTQFPSPYSGNVQGPNGAAPSGSPGNYAQNNWNNMIGYLGGQHNGFNPQGIDPNYLGVAQGAYAHGQLAGMAQNNENQSQGNANENQGFNREAVTKQQQISAGMQQAAMKGGYGGVVDYLNTADPERSLAIQKEKSSLDQSMLTSQSMQMQNSDQQKASLFAGYGLLGKMGATILAAPVGERQALYSQMLPMVKAVNPDAPPDVASATPMLMLGAGQAMTASQHWAAAGEVDATNSTIGKANADLQALRTQGVPDTSPQSQALVSQIKSAQLDGVVKQNTVDDLSNKNLLQQQALTKGNQDQAKNKYELISKISGDYEKQSGNYAKYQSAYTQYMSAQKQLMANPNDGTAQAQMAALTPKMLGYMRASPAIMASMANTDNGAEKFTKDLTNRFNPGGTQVMTPKEIGRLTNLVTSTYQGMSGLQDSVNATKFQQAKSALLPFQDQTLSPADQQSAAASAAAGIVHYTTSDPEIPTQQKIDSDLQEYRSSGKYSEPQLQQAKSLMYNKYGYYNLDHPQ